nr:MAG TPA: hypothetical protein [Herelleviridae sp.]
MRGADIQKQRRKALEIITDYLRDFLELDVRLSLTQMSVKDNNKNVNYVIVKPGKVETNFKKSIDIPKELEYIIKYLELINIK